jgi:signal transduction histidine kinase/DNA-binding NarL/FixJ family response regulator
MFIETPNIRADRRRYIINDFRSDPHYSTRPYVTGFPYMVSYAEVPLISPLGYVLGSYCIVDSKLRDFDSDHTIEVLSEIANSIMRHLELVRLEQNRARAEKLIKGLGEFMERESPVPNDDSRARSYSESSGPSASEAYNVPDITDESAKLSKEPAASASSNEAAQLARPEVHRSSSNSGTSTRTGSSSIEPVEMSVMVDTPPSTPPQHQNEQNPFDAIDLILSEAEAQQAEERTATVREPDPPLQPQESTVSADVRTTFTRAACLIRETMSMDGLIFLDACPNGFGSRSNHPTPHEQEDPFQSDIADDGADTEDTQAISELIAGSWTSGLDRLAVLEPHMQLPEAIVQRFIRRFPRGHIFTADEFGPIDCSFGPGTNPKKRPSKSQRRTSTRASNDIEELFRFLPGARYVIFLPLWHFQRESWFGATFGWVKDATQAMDVEDLNLLSAFGHSVMADVSRFEALAISRAKSDFISSISHELRSPLHGILASGELLREAVEDPSLLSLLDMIDSCGTTLLDTFNNLLDFAKINNIAQAGRPTELASGPPKSKSEITAQDLSNLVQDVVDGVHLGHTKTSVLMTTHNENIFTSVPVYDQGGEHSPDEAILVTVNIEKRPSWVTKLDAGAWRRIVMNLVGMLSSSPYSYPCLHLTTGNALKYTRSGHVGVGLKLVQRPDKRNLTAKTHVCFSVADTGIGMSEDYVKYQLFTPFVQENSLSPGTGLGLSIVSQIVKNLHGTIDVKSEIGRGTVIKVFIPLNQDSGRPFSLQLAPITEDSSLHADHIFKGRSLCYISPQAYKSLVDPGFDITSDVQDRAIALHKALSQIASDVLGMDLRVAASDNFPDSDLYFLDAHLLGEALNSDCSSYMLKRLRVLTPLVVMCGAKAGLPRLFRSDRLKESFFTTPHPLGARKLAIAFSEALRSGKSCPPIIDEQLSARPSTPPENSARRAASDSLTIRTRELGPQKDASRSFDGLLDDVSPTTLPALQEQFPPTNAELTHNTQPMTSTTLSASASSPPQSPHAAHHNSLISSPESRLLTQMPRLESTPSLCQHLLLVDDNPINLKILTTIVKKMFCTFVPASNGLEAVQIYKSSNHHFDVIFMDISMPVMDGFTATREIRAYEREMKLPPSKIVALTGLGSAASRQEAFASGTNLFLTKPVRLQEVRKLLVKRGEPVDSQKVTQDNSFAQTSHTENQESFDVQTPE